MAPEIIGSIAGAGLSTLGSLLGASYSQDYNRENIGLQSKAAKELANYQWQNFSSPEAQVRALNKVGLGVNAFVGGKGQAAQPSVNMPSSAPISVDGVADLGGIASYIQSVANAKKAGMDTKLSEQEIKNKEVQRQRDEFELQLRKVFGKDQISSELANSYMQLVLASDQSDINEIQKAIGRWNEVKSKAEAKTSEHQRDIAKQLLDNNPTAIKLENRLKELQGNAASAQAEAAHTQANVNRELRRLNAALADVEEGGKKEKIKSLVSEYHKNQWINDVEKKEAEIKLQRLEDLDWGRDSEFGIRLVDDLLDWFKDKVSIFK